MKITARQYAQLFFLLEQEIPREKVDSLVDRLVSFIRKNKDWGKRKKILEKYEILRREMSGARDMTIIAAREPDDQAVERIKRTVADKKGVDYEKINIRQQIDKTIGGGLIVKIDNEIWDGSLKKKLEKMKRSLLN
ncbi:MAG: F0F1 ATP synthase subunit delta [Candidatus Moranbacteria bacterium]|jgi:F-type H+-transporting ATPase subunit delta|nr:F0F1 ATP synthase subunit delta [Candidatus Moranbacteria bacterium]